MRSIHRQRRLRTKALGLVSSMVLVALLVGVPLWLASTAGLPSLHVDGGALWHAVGHRGPADDREVAHWLGRVAVLLAWAAWAWLTVCVVVELLAWRSGRTPVRLPASRSVQCAAAFLVGTALAVGSLGRLPVHTTGAPEAVRSGPPAPGSSTGSVDNGPRVARAEGSRSSDDGPGPTPDGRLPVDPYPVTDGVGLDATAERSTSFHTVSDRETLWSVAEDRLGAARRWRDIAELNYGVAQPDGSSLDGSHWILPGWVLRLPPADGTDAVDPAPVGRPAAPVGRPAAPVGRPAAPLRPAAVATRADTASDRAGTPTARPDPAVPAERALASSGPGHVRPGVPVVPLGAGIVGAGVADLVDRLRRVQQRHRAAGHQIRLPDPALRPFEQRLRVGDGAADLDAVEAALQALAAMGPGWPEGGRLTGVTLGDDRVRLTFDTLETLDADAASPPFTREADGRSLWVDRAALPTSGGPRGQAWARSAAATLVSVGRSGATLAMVVLEGLGSVVIDGDPLVTEGLGRAMALELATSRWAGDFDLVLVGFGAAMAHGSRVSVAAEAGPVIADLSWRRLTTSMRLADGGVPAADLARRLGAVGDWAPVVVVCAPTVPTEDVDAILELAGDGRHGICAVAMAGGRTVPPTAAHVLLAQPSSDGASMDVLGTVVAAQTVDGSDLDGVTAVLEAAAVLDDAPDAAAEQEAVPPPLSSARDGATFQDRTAGYASVGPATTAQVLGDPAAGSRHRHRDAMVIPATPRHGPRPAPGDRAEVEVEVAVLGPVEVRGAARGFTRAWALELVVYLAMHPTGAANEVWATALWPDRLMAPSSLHSTASVARRSLGTARDGSDHLPRSHGRLALAPTVGTDWTRFLELAASDDPDRWEEALTTIRGRPFEGIRATDWALLDGTGPAIEAKVVDVSGHLAGARLRSGDPQGAEWAARRGLLVSPYDERLYRMLLRAADAAGNPGGVESVMAELVRVVADEVEPIESVHPSTLALYRSLSRRTSTVLGGSVRA